MIECSSTQMCFDFMHKHLNLKWSDDFRGVMFIPDHFKHVPADQDHVGVAYAWSNFIGRSCVISIVVQKPECLTRKVIREAFRFPFEVAGCKVMLALVDSDNAASISLCERTGFEKSLVIPDGGLVGDLIVYQMRKDSCPWLRKVH